MHQALWAGLECSSFRDTGWQLSLCLSQTELPSGQILHLLQSYPGMSKPQSQSHCEYKLRSPGSSSSEAMRYKHYIAEGSSHGDSSNCRTDGSRSVQGLKGGSAFAGTWSVLRPGPGFGPMKDGANSTRFLHLPSVSLHPSSSSITWGSLPKREGSNLCFRMN